MTLFVAAEPVVDKYPCTCSPERLRTSIYHAPGCPKPKSSFSAEQQLAAYGCPHGDWRFACPVCSPEVTRG